MAEKQNGYGTKSTNLAADQTVIIEGQQGYGKKIPVVFPNNPEIFKVQNPDGSKNYCMKYGEKVETYNCDLYYYLTDTLLHFNAITELLEGNKYSYLYKTLISHFFKEFATLVHFLEKEFGSVIKVQITDMGLNEQVIGISSSFQKPTEKKRSQDMGRERDIRSLWRMENHVKGFTESMKFIQSCFNLSENERTEQDVTFFNKKVDELADRLKKAFASANS